MNKKNTLLKQVDHYVEEISGTKVPLKKTTANNWIKEWFTINKVKYSYDGNHSIYDLNKKSTVLTSVKLIESYITLGSSIANVKDAKFLIRAFIDTWEHNQKEIVRNQMIKTISFDPNEINNNQLAKFTEALTGETNELDNAVIYNFIHSVKRKILGKRPDIDLFPVLFGVQNSGKSTAVRKILSPIKRFTTDRSLDILSQEKNLKVLSTKYVICFDEMAKTKMASIEAIKKHTTAERVAFRLYYSQDEVNLPNVSTFIGCSNKPVSELFYDPTGARRFYEIICLPRINWKKINEIDYVKLWKSIDENKDTPLKTLRDDLRKHQEKLRTIDNVEDFITSEGIAIEDSKPTMEVTFSDLYKAYIMWMSSQKMSGTFSKRKFAIKLDELGIKRHRTSDSRYRIINKMDFYSLINKN